MRGSNSDIIDLLCTLAEEEKLRVTVKESLKGGLIAGIAAFAGSVLLGPMGLALGGTIGGCLAAYTAQGKYLPAVQVIATMQPEQRNLLANKISRIMTSIDVKDVAMFAAMITGDISIRTRVLETLVDHLRSELSLAIVDHC